MGDFADDALEAELFFGGDQDAMYTHLAERAERTPRPVETIDPVERRRREAQSAADRARGLLNWMLQNPLNDSSGWPAYKKRIEQLLARK